MNTFAFGPFTLIPERQLLLQGEAPVRIGGRALDILAALVERPGAVVGKHQLMSRVWPDVVVDEGSLKVNIAALRRTLGDGPGTPQYIATVTGRGYRFIAPVRAGGSPDTMPASPAVAGRNHNLPTGTTRIFGRSETIDALRRELEGARLVSIVGAGGIGKTTVALAVAEHALGSLKDGVWLVDLALLQDPALVPHAIATTIGLAAHSASMLTPLCDFLREREMLLVMDNCEHIIDAAAYCASRILLEAAGVKILVTSREPLLVKGERVRRLPALGMPPTTSPLNAREALAFPAIQLFVDRATDRLESFRFGDADASTVAEICRKVDGLALAIEFAATRIDAFSVGGLLKQLDDSFRQRMGRRAGPVRHRTLTAMLDWSYGLLSKTEAAVLRSVSVFAGAFDTDGAAAVSNMTSTEAADTLAQLAAKSLLATDLDAVGVAYRLLETTRTYSLERLRAGGDDQRVLRRHAEHVCLVLDRAAAEWPHRTAREWGAAYGRVLDDLRAALAFARQDAAQTSLLLRLTVAGTLLWNHFSLTEECRGHVAQALGQLDAAGLGGTAVEMTLQLSFGGTMMFAGGIMPEVGVALQRALDIAVRIGNTDHQLRGLRLTACYEQFTGQHDASIRTLEAFSSVAAATDPSALRDADAHLGLAEIFIGRPRICRQRLEAIFHGDLQALEDKRFVRFQYDRKVDVGSVLSKAQWLTGSPDAAMRTAKATVEWARKTRHDLSLSNALAVAACPTAFLNGHYQEADRYVAMLNEQVTRHGIAAWRPIVLFYRSALAYVRSGATADGVEGIAQAVAEFRAIHHWARMPYYLGFLADTLVKCGRLGDADTTIRAALDSVRAQNEQWCLPEILRIRASILAAEDQVDEAEGVLVESMELAQQIGTLSWRLRTANDLAKLWRRRSRADDARRMLLPVFDEFTEGFSTSDLVACADLLASLSRPGDDQAP